MEGVIAVFIPIIMVVVVGLVFVTYFYYRSRERQMLIEKGLSGEEIKQFFDKKRDYFVLFKIGIIAIFFGIGLGERKSNSPSRWVCTQSRQHVRTDVRSARTGARPRDSEDLPRFAHRARGTTMHRSLRASEEVGRERGLARRLVRYTT